MMGCRPLHLCPFTVVGRSRRGVLPENFIFRSCFAAFVQTKFSSRNAGFRLAAWSRDGEGRR